MWLLGLSMIRAHSARCVPFRRRAGQRNASPEGRAELRQSKTRFVGSVAYFPERYGENLIRVSLDILNQRPVPPAVFVEHKLVTPGTVDHYYPNDALAKLVRTEPLESLRQHLAH